MKQKLSYNRNTQILPKVSTSYYKINQATYNIKEDRYV